MCLILLAVDQHPDYPVVLAANRDEFHARPSLPAGRWPDIPAVFGGRDLEKGGSWLAFSPGGRFACVTNFREPPPLRKPQLSRGLLVRDFVRGQERPLECLARMEEEGHRYRGFSLLVGQGREIGYASNRGPRMMLGPGLYGVANALLDTPWPKVVHGKQQLALLLEKRCLDPAKIFDLLMDRSVRGKASPQAGFPGSANESQAPIFVRSPDFGTRCSSLLLIDQADRTTFIERTFFEGGEDWSEIRLDIP
ncbi:MAG: NRDE family protein [Syntrophotaleaceae bacterium]